MSRNPYFEIFNIQEYLKNPVPCYDREYFKICIIEPESKMHFANRSVLLDKTALLFSNPMMPAEWEGISLEPSGYFCRFNIQFIENSELLKNTSIKEFVFNAVYYPNTKQIALLYTFFQKMMEEKEINLKAENEVLQLYVKLILLETSKMQPNDIWHTPIDASSRITSLFLELLNHQFNTIDKNYQPILKMPHEFANQLSIHINHLNDSVQKTLGKSTTLVIQERIIREAKKMLKNTSWTISEISYAFGFEYSNNFSKFFKNSAGVSPSIFRKNNL